MPEARSVRRDLARCPAAADREDVDAGREPVLRRVSDVLLGVMTEDEVAAIRRDPVIVVDSRGKSGRNLLKAPPLGTARRQAIEPTFAVHHKEASVTRPVGRLEVSIVAIDRFDAPGFDLHRAERAADGAIGLAEHTARHDEARQEKHHDTALARCGVFQRSIGLAMPCGRKGSMILRPSPADAYAAYRTSCTTRPVSPSEIGVSWPRTQRAKCRISWGKP